MKVQKETPISKHIFMFAFKWNYLNQASKGKSKKYRKFNEKVDLEKFDEKIGPTEKDNDNSPWQIEEYKENKILDYNEYTYYYHNVRDAIYGHKTQGSIKHKVNIYHYGISASDEAKYIIKALIKDKQNTSYKEKEYHLALSKIELKVYDTGVGILSFFTDNYDHEVIEDINRINNYGRRIYPQFIEQKDGASPTQKTKETFLASTHLLKLGKGRKNELIETYSSDYETEGNRISNIVMGLLGDNFKTGRNASPNASSEDAIAINPLIDDRMFVICWYANKELADELRQIETEGQDEHYSYIRNSKWYKFIFMEREKNCQSKWMMQDILKRHTYERWVDYGTLYGMSYCSFVCLTDGSEFSTKNVLRHVSTIYYQLMCLVLAQKASILRFEDELTDISNHSKDIPEEAVEEVYQRYLQFINGIYFREVTAQEQGIELYNMAQNIMRVDIDVAELKEEIGHLFQYITLRADKETNSAINSLTYVNTLIIIPSLITGFFGMNIFEDKFKEHWNITNYKKLAVWSCIWIIAVGIMPIAIIKTKGLDKWVRKIPQGLRIAIPWIILGAAIMAATLIHFFL